MHLRASLAGVVTIAAVTVITGCSSFREDVQAARTRNIPADSVEGLWEGRWYEADKPSHGGRLRCVLTRTGDNMYRIASRSQWKGIFSSSYDSILILTPASPGEFLVQGGRDIWPFGVYSVTGRVDATQFKATFSIADQVGVMEMQRPATMAAN